MQIGVFNDGLAHLLAEEAFEWCAERGHRPHRDGSRWMGARRPTSSTSPRCCPSQPRATGWSGELREHGLGAVVRERRRQPAAPRPRIGDRHAARCAARSSSPTCWASTTVVTMSGCPGRPRRRQRRRVRAVGAVGRRRVAVGVAVRASARAVLARALRAGRREVAPEVHICLELHPGASAYSSGVVSAARRGRPAPTWRVNFDPSHFWWQGIDPLCVIDERRRSDRLCPRQGHAAVSRPDPPPRRDRLPFPGRPRRRHLALRRGRRRPRRGRVGDAASRRSARAGYDGDVSIEHEDPRLDAEHGIERSLARCGRLWRTVPAA